MSSSVLNLNPPVFSTKNSGKDVAVNVFIYFSWTRKSRLPECVRCEERTKHVEWFSSRSVLVNENEGNVYSSMIRTPPIATGKNWIAKESVWYMSSTSLPSVCLLRASVSTRWREGERKFHFTLVVHLSVHSSASFSPFLDKEKQKDGSNQFMSVRQSERCCLRFVIIPSVQ